MHLKILSAEQKNLLPLINDFSRQYYLVGGTAIALHIGHRSSIDFDLFTTSATLNIKALKDKIYKNGYGQYERLFEDTQQKHIIINGVKITFFCFPFAIPTEVKIFKSIRIPSLLTLGAMKAFALGGRNKWKDYVDLYFILKKFHTIAEVESTAKKLFGKSFSGRLFRSQLSYFKDIDYSEQVDFLPGFETPEDEIKDFLVDVATAKF